MSLFLSKKLKTKVLSYFVLSSIFLTSAVLQSADTDTLELKLNIKKGDKFSYQDDADLNLYLDLPPEFLKEMKEDKSVDPMTKKMFVEPIADAIAQKKPLLTIKLSGKDQVEVANVNDAKDRFSLTYSLWLTNLYFQEFVQGNKIVFDSAHPENNSAPAELPLALKDSKNLFPIVFGMVVDPQYRVVELIDLHKAAEKIIDNVSSPFITEDQTKEIKAKINEFAVEANKERQEKFASAFTIYPSKPVKVGDSWITSLSPELENEWNEIQTKDASEDELFAIETGKKVYDKIYKVKITFKSRKDGIATFQIEPANKDDVTVRIIENYAVNISGNLVDAIAEINESNGNVISLKHKTNLAVKFTFDGDLANKKVADPQYALFRIESNSSSVLTK